jgi:hypothetical protein
MIGSRWSIQSITMWSFGIAQAGRLATGRMSGPISDSTHREKTNPRFASFSDDQAIGLECF